MSDPFIGLTMLGLIVTRFAYEEYPQLPEGELAKLRAAVVSGLSLQVLIVTVPGLRRVFGTAHLTWREWALVLTAGAVPTLVMAVSRRFVETSARRSARPVAVR